jgi:glycosyltransferase involved in cell wall biosynthesis
MQNQLRVVALIPAYNEEASIAATIRAMLQQERVPDEIVVIPNGCSDGTAEVARQFPITVLELPRLAHKKSEALNTAWREYGQSADLIICLDADTVMPPNAVRDWAAEFEADAQRIEDEVVWWDSPEAETVKVRPAASGGSPGWVLFQVHDAGKDFLTRLQRAEFSRWTDTALRRGWTSVLAGTGAAISGEALRQVAARDDRDGPWAYTSQVEDFELTYRIRELGFRCQVSPTVRAYTDSMKTVKALWGQRMKWQVGTIEDLLKIGVNRLTVLDWWQQFSGIFLRVRSVPLGRDHPGPLPGRSPSLPVAMVGHFAAVVRGRSGEARLAHPAPGHDRRGLRLPDLPVRGLRLDAGCLVHRRLGPRPPRGPGRKAERPLDGPVQRGGVPAQSARQSPPDGAPVGMFALVTTLVTLAIGNLYHARGCPT